MTVAFTQRYKCSPAKMDETQEQHGWQPERLKKHRNAELRYRYANPFLLTCQCPYLVGEVDKDSVRLP